MKKTNEQLQQEATEIRRFIDGDSKQTAKKVIPIAYNVAIGTMECDCAYCPYCGQKLDWSDAHEIN